MECERWALGTDKVDGHQQCTALLFIALHCMMQRGQ